MLNKKMIALIAAGALAACLALAGCGGSQAASSSAASSSAAATPAASASATSASAGASSAAAPASSAATSASAAAPSASASAATPSASASASSSYIGDYAAIDIALGHAGFTRNDVTGLKAELDTDDAIVHYDVDFKQGGMEYDYDIDATTGAIISSSSEVDD